MGGLDFKEPLDREQEDEQVIAHNTRTALRLFAVYVAFYATFMLLSAFRPDFMARPFLGGVNLAVVFGFSLIVIAMILALIYMKLSRKNVDRSGEEGDKR